MAKTEKGHRNAVSGDLTLFEEPIYYGLVNWL